MTGDDEKNIVFTSDSLDAIRREPSGSVVVALRNEDLEKLREFCPNLSMFEVATWKCEKMMNAVIKKDDAAGP